jgi:hypothetical protein
VYGVLAVVVLLLLIAVARANRSHLRRVYGVLPDDGNPQAEPQLSEARKAGFALTDAINASGDVETAAREAARTALAVCREVDGERPTDLELPRKRLETAAATADSAAEDAAALARRIRLHHCEIMRAAESSPLKLELLNLAGSEAMEYRSYAEETAASLDDLADQARRAAAEARARGSGLPR